MMHWRIIVYSRLTLYPRDAMEINSKGPSAHGRLLLVSVLAITPKTIGKLIGSYFAVREGKEGSIVEL